MFSLHVKFQSKVSSRSLKSLLKYCSLQMVSTPGSLVEIVRSVMIYFPILTTTLFVLHAIETAYYIISSPVFGSQRNIFHGNSRTYLQFFSSGDFFSSAFLCSSSNFFFCYFQVLQFFWGVYPRQGLDSRALIVTLSASRTNKSVTGGVSLGLEERLSQTYTNGFDLV